MKIRDDRGMTRKQLRALVLLEHFRVGVVANAETCVLDNQLWVNHQTARALQDRGFAEIRGEGDATEVVLG